MRRGTVSLLGLLCAGAVSEGAAAAAGAVYDVLQFGARGDGATDDSASIVKAYAACAAGGGGTVLFRAGFRFVSGPLQLACNDSVTELEDSAVLVARNTTSGWGFGADCPEPSQGKTPKQMAPFLLVEYGRNITLTGGGTVDANGAMWWALACGNWYCPGPDASQPALDASDGPAKVPLGFRPFLFRIDHSSDIVVHSVSLLNPGFWCLVPVHSRRLTFTNLTISAAHALPEGVAHNASTIAHAHSDTPNTDGIEPMWSSDITVRDTFINNGDDCITIKSGSRNILVEDLVCENGDGLTIGSIWYDDVTNVTYRRVLMNGTHNGPMVKGRSQGNATVRDITFEDVVLIGVRLAMTIDCDYETPGTVVPNLGVSVLNVVYKNVTGTVRAGVDRFAAPNSAFVDLILAYVYSSKHAVLMSMPLKRSSHNRCRVCSHRSGGGRSW